MLKNFYDYLNIPKECLLNVRIYKKLFLESNKLDYKDKKVILNDINQIKWVYTLKPETINIPAFFDEKYSYEELAIIQIDLLNKKRLNQISNFIGEASENDWIIISDVDEIPNPKVFQSFDAKKKYAFFEQILYQYETRIQSLFP